MARPARDQRQHSYAESDVEVDDMEASEEETTPRPNRKSKPRKRVSDAFVPNGDATGSPSRVPFMQVNLNDDEAEKRRRRKSKKLVQPSITGYEGHADEQPAGQSSAATETPRANRHFQHKQQLMAIAETPIINVPIDVMNSNFEEWMKLATDNKINATNSWNFALIDYFHDMSLLRNNGDNSINFQKASATLDGCVKIWTSRVDSVGTETGRLLSNLAEDGQPVDEEEEAETVDPETGEVTQRVKRTTGKTHRPESTLAKNAAQLRTKKFDLEFSVDPLFKKTCADFDEGGAQGLLMNHLSLGTGTEGSMRVIFDASDSMGKIQEEDEDLVEPEALIDISNLRAEFLPDLSVLESKAISYSIADFAFGTASSNAELANFSAENGGMVDDDDDDDAAGDLMADPMDVDFDNAENNGPVEDFFGGNDAIEDDYVGLNGDLNNPEMSESGGMQHVDPRRQLGGVEPFDPHRAPNERDLILAMTEAGAEGGSLDYFDQAFLKNWAGPEHWKLRKVIRRPDQSAESSGKQKKEKKEPFKIDFLTPSTSTLEETMKTLFAPVSKGGSITLPQASSKSNGKRGKGRRSKNAERRYDHTLPDDMHFSSRQLVTLFLKPKFALKMRGHGARFNANDGEVDENFWAQAANDQTIGPSDAADESNEGAIPFNTQFFHDEYDDGAGFDDVYDGDGEGGLEMNGASGAENGEQDLLAATQGQSRRVRPELVNYAKRAKRVDVRKLKDNIWKGLHIVVPEAELQDDDGDTAMRDDENQEPTGPSEARMFTSVISDLEASYPKEKMEEISTSFCFICLLHLANERGLKIEGEALDVDDMTAADGDGEDDADRPVSDIWGLKIYRDPTAMASA